MLKYVLQLNNTSLYTIITTKLFLSNDKNLHEIQLLPEEICCMIFSQKFKVVLYIYFNFII